MTKYTERDHPGQSSFAMNFSDETGEDRPGATMHEFVNKLRQLSNEYGFDIQTWGPTEKFVRAVAPAYMDQVYVMRDRFPEVE